MDIEGSELKAIQGMKNTILDNPQIKIIIELIMQPINCEYLHNRVGYIQFSVRDN